MAEETNPQTSTPQETAQPAEGAGAAPASGGNGPDYTAFFAQLDAVLDRRSAGIARSALTDNGVSKEEAHAIVEAYKQHREGVARQQAQAADELRQENRKLRDALLRGRIEAAVTAQAQTLGVDAAAVPYLLRLADLSGAADGEGNVNPQAVTEALGKVLADLPGLKSQGQGSGFVPVGSDGGSASPNSDNRMRAWFGLGPKK